jgi:hypothetical protein
MANLILKEPVIDCRQRYVIVRTSSVTLDHERNNFSIVGHPRKPPYEEVVFSSVLSI